jgi:hypothetical protein
MISWDERGLDWTAPGILVEGKEAPVPDRDGCLAPSVVKNDHPVVTKVASVVKKLASRVKKVASPVKKVGSRVKKVGSRVKKVGSRVNASTHFVILGRARSWFMAKNMFNYHN